MNLTFVTYYTIVNLTSLTFIMFDKNRAIRQKRRISELSFFTLSFLGGFLGIGLGMMASRHKTRKLTFQLKVLLGVALHVSIYIIYYQLNR